MTDTTDDTTKNPEDMDSDKTREWRGSVCVGILTEGWPWGKLRVSRDHIEVNSRIGHYSLPQADVVSITRGRFFPWLWMGICIYHTGTRCPELAFSPFLFWRRRQILDHLTRLGYKVT